MNHGTARRRLILHIGVHRTGTTSIQMLLAGNREALEKQGFHYAFNTDNHTGLAGQIKTGQLTATAFIDDLVADSREREVHSVIVSGEDFSRLKSVKTLEALKAHFDVRVVCYLRRQDSWLESWYNQHLKWPWHIRLSKAGPEEFFSRWRAFHWIDYQRLLTRWARVFGQDNLRVRVFERGQLEGSLEEDFCHLCGIDHDRLRETVVNVNASVPAQAAEFLRHLDLFTRDNASRLILLNTVTLAYQRAGWTGEKHVFSARQRRQVLQSFADSNAAVARTYLGRADGTLFREPWPLDDDAAPGLALAAAPELIVEIVRPLVRDLLRRLQRNRSPNSPNVEVNAKLVALEQLHARLAGLQAELHAKACSPTYLARRSLRLLLPGAAATHEFTPGDFHELDDDPPGASRHDFELPHWMESLPPEISTMPPERFLAEEAEPLLSGLVRSIKEERRRKQHDSEGMELLIEKQQLANEGLRREIHELERELATPGSALRRLFRLFLQYFR